MYVKSTTITLGYCGVPAVGDNTVLSVLVTSGKHINIMDLHQRNKEWQVPF